jgi:hypothetical protein
LLGEHSVLEPPESFSNSEVKRHCADDSVAFAHAKVGHHQAPYTKKPSTSLGFLRSTTLICLYPKPKTQNPKPKTQNPKPKTQNPKPTNTRYILCYLFIFGVMPDIWGVIRVIRCNTNKNLVAKAKFTFKVNYLCRMRR